MRVEPMETWREVTLRLAWAAGFFDGEGCTGFRSDTRRHTSERIAISVTQQSSTAAIIPSVLQRFHRAVGGAGAIAAACLDERSGTFAHQWRASSFEETQAVVALLWANLGPVKRSQANAALRGFLAQYQTISARKRKSVQPRRFDLSGPGPAAPAVEQNLA